MPLAKTAEVVERSQDTTSHPQSVEIFTIEGVPYDVYSFFGADLQNTGERDREKLKDIYSHFKAEHKTLGDVMQEVSTLENRLGLGGYTSRLDRVWNWVRLSGRIKDLELRKQALERR